MSIFDGTVRTAFVFDDCYVLEVGTGGKLFLYWRSKEERARAIAQQQLNDTVTALQRIAASAGLVWPANA